MKPTTDILSLPFLQIAGPCSAESEQQVMLTASAVKQAGASVFRAGLWKPRTSPNSFEGVGVKGITWLNRVQKELGMPVTTEVMNPEQVKQCLEAGIRILWIGARTTTSPYLVQSIADAIAACKHDDVVLLVKNPISPDIGLWIGAIERFKKAGIKQLIAVHRGFLTSEGGIVTNYRYSPLWHLPISLRLRKPGMKIICDASHIAGDAALVAQVAQHALSLGADGLMTEVHPTPSEALSDARQQLTIEQYQHLIEHLHYPIHQPTDNKLLALREQIDEVDEALWQGVLKRLQLAKEIGRYKQEHNMPILQEGRIQQILSERIAWGKQHGISEQLIRQITHALHTAAIDIQMTHND